MVSSKAKIVAYWCLVSLNNLLNVFVNQRQNYLDNKSFSIHFFQTNATVHVKYNKSSRHQSFLKGQPQQPKCAKVHWSSSSLERMASTLHVQRWKAILELVLTVPMWGFTRTTWKVAGATWSLLLLSSFRSSIKDSFCRLLSWPQKQTEDSKWSNHT